MEKFTWRDGTLLVRAPAKINLVLLIKGKRPDGYHEIDTVMAKVDWCDELTFEQRDEPGIELRCTGPEWSPAGSDNHVYTACRMLMESKGYRGGVRVTLDKQIPAGTGLGSASSDAAAALMGLNEFAGLGAGDAELAEIAAAIGSDVPFFLGGPLARCRGRGEIVLPLRPEFDFSAILVLPNVIVSTKKVYEVYTAKYAQWSGADGEAAALIEAGDIAGAAGMCVNMLEPPCFAVNEELGHLKEVLSSLGFGRVCLSGSGSAMYVLVDPVNFSKRNNYQHMIQERTGCRSVIVNNNRW